MSENSKIEWTFQSPSHRGGSCDSHLLGYAVVVAVFQSLAHRGSYSGRAISH